MHHTPLIHPTPRLHPSAMSYTTLEQPLIRASTTMPWTTKYSAELPPYDLCDTVAPMAAAYADKSSSQRRPQDAAPPAGRLFARIRSSVDVKPSKVSSRPVDTPSSGGNTLPGFEDGDAPEQTRHAGAEPGGRSPYALSCPAHAQQFALVVLFDCGPGRRRRGLDHLEPEARKRLTPRCSDVHCNGARHVDCSSCGWRTNTLQRSSISPAWDSRSCSCSYSRCSCSCSCSPFLSGLSKD
ncbi:hypothetical protein BD310DRAFT_1000137, partial [Dichomitus squalens]